MELAPLQPLIREFIATWDTDPMVDLDIETHHRRQCMAAELLRVDRIPTLSRVELEAFLAGTEAWIGVRGRNEFWRKLVGEHDQHMPAVRDDLADLVNQGEAGLDPAGFRHFLDQFPGMGSAVLSELLALRFPEKYWMASAPLREFLRSEGVDIKQGLPWGKKADPGEEYFAIGRQIRPLQRALEHVAQGDVDFLGVDLFIHWVNRKRNPDAASPSALTEGAPRKAHPEGTSIPSPFTRKPASGGPAAAPLEPEPAPETETAGALDETPGDASESLLPAYSLDRLCAETFLDKAFWSDVESLLVDRKQIVFYGPPGTGKTHAARLFARFWVDAATDPHGQVSIVPLHPSYTYEQFIEGAIPTKDGHGSVRRGIFRSLCDEARMHPRRRYALILDELQRCDLPRILGELLFLLEYRDESAVLPYSGESFSVPSNVFLIGGLNTADRSSASLDVGVRRRFHFVRMAPDPRIVRAYLTATGQAGMAWVGDALTSINHRLTQDGLDWQQHLGHGHFMRTPLTEAHLRLLWEHDIVPMLNEYFQREPQRLRGYDFDLLCGSTRQP